MAEEDGKSAIDRLREGLYKRGESTTEERSGFYEREFSVPRDWADSSAPVGAPPPFLGASGEMGGIPMPSFGGNGPSFWGNLFTMKKLLIAAVLFFGIAVLFFLFVILRGANIVSSKNVSILVDGPASIEAGEEIALKISIENRNNIALEFTDLLVEFPEGTRVAKNLEEELARYRKSLGTIAPGKTVAETVDAVLFGQEGDEKELAITIEYRAKGSNAIFVAEKKYQVHISASPFAVEVAMPAEVIAKQEFVFEIALSSKTDEVVEDVAVAADYPFGFSFISASPAPSFGTDIWYLGDVTKGARRAITVRGTLLGQDGDEKTFRIEGGLSSGAGAGKLNVVYGATQKTVRIVRPSLGVTPSLGGDDADVVAVSAGKRTSAEIFLSNNTPTKIIDVRVAAELLGEALDKGSVDASVGGFYRSLDSTIIWDKNAAAGLGEIAPGETVRLPFSFTPFSPLTSAVRIKNPVIALTVLAEGKHLGSDGTLKDIRVEAGQTAKITSDIELTARAVYHGGPFANSGPLPPKAEQETTYTVFWAVVNTANDVRGVSVEARLPAYVRWVGAISPANESISYDPDSRMVTWRAGDIVSWKGIASLPREAAFQVGLVPSVSQIGRAPVIVEDAALRAEDEFTDAALSDTNPAVTTNLTADPQFTSGDGTVIQQ